MKRKAATKKAKDKTSAPEVKLACTVIQNRTKIGAMLCLRGAKANLPEDKARALEELGKVRIDGVA
jgi:hypothetical protein